MNGWAFVIATVVGLGGLVVSASAVAEVEDRGGSNVEKRVHGNAKHPPGVPAVDIPAFPATMNREQIVRALSALPKLCGGESYGQTADHVDSVVGGRSDRSRAALLNLIFTENGLSREALRAAIVSLGRHKGGAAALRQIVTHSNAIAQRVVEGHDEDADNGHVIKEVVVRVVEYDLLVAVIEAAKLSRSSEGREVIKRLTKSDVFDIGDLARAALLGG